jgi:hypothetical protein
MRRRLDQTRALSADPDALIARKPANEEHARVVAGRCARAVPLQKYETVALADLALDLEPDVSHAVAVLVER